MGKSSQRKGREGEKSLAKYLQDHGYPVQVGAPENRGRTPDAFGMPFIHIECKRVEKLNVPEAMRQSKADSEKFGDGFPTLFHRRNREPWLVTMYADDFFEIYDGFLDERNKEETQSEKR